MYGIVANIYSLKEFPILTELELSYIPYKKISVIVSGTGYKSLEGLPTELLAQLLVKHQQTIEKLMDNGFSMILPMQLGSIVNSSDEISTLLENNYNIILKTLHNTKHMLEMDLIVMWNNISDVFERISQQEDIIMLKQSYLKDNNKEAKTKRQEIGHVVKQKLDHENNKIREYIETSLSPYYVNKRYHATMDDTMIANIAFLLNRSNRTHFESMIDKIDKQLSGRLDFKLVGPLPCYSFYTIKIRHLEFSQVMKAKEILGLNDRVTDNEIRKSYLEKVKHCHPDVVNGDSHQNDFVNLQDAYQTLVDYVSTLKTDMQNEKISLASKEKAGNIIKMTIEN